MTMISIKGFMEIPVEQRKFVVDYLEMIDLFHFKTETYRDKQDDLPIQNTDLWIESYIDMIPELQEFRDHVRSEMERLGIEKHPYYTYQKKYNYYYYSNKRTLEGLRESLKNIVDENKVKCLICGAEVNLGEISQYAAFGGLPSPCCEICFEVNDHSCKTLEEVASRSLKRREQEFKP